MSAPNTEPFHVAHEADLHPHRPLAVVTGASRNIGRAIAARLASAGFSIVATTSPRDREADAIGRDNGWDVASFDLADADACNAFVRFLSDRHGRLDCLVNNAATWVFSGVETTDHDWRHVLEVNVVAPARLIREALPLLRRSHCGRVVNIGSISGWFSEHEQAAYSASKAAIHALTRSFAIELAHEGITVNAVAPGLMNTTTNQPGDHDARPKLVPLGSFGAPEEVGNLVAFLASAEARYITGTIITCDGGVTAAGIFAPLSAT